MTIMYCTCAVAMSRVERAELEDSLLISSFYTTPQNFGVYTAVAAGVPKLGSFTAF